MAFLVDEFGLIDDKHETARGPRVVKPAHSRISWSDLVHDEMGKVPFLIRPDILTSDEAIVGVFAHELFELEKLRSLIQKSTITVEQFIAHTCPGNPGILHDQAWTYADELVEKMREEK